MLYLVYFLITMCILWLLWCVSSSPVQNQNKLAYIRHFKYYIQSEFSQHIILKGRRWVEGAQAA